MNQLHEAFLRILFQGLAGSLIFLVPLWGPQLVLRRKSLSKSVTRSSPLTAKVPTIGVADGLILMSFMACANAIVGFLRDEIPFAALVLQGICINLLVFLVWYQCQKLMRHYEVLNPRSRVIIQLVMYPLSLVAFGQVIVSSLTFVSSIVAYTRMNSSGEFLEQTVASGALLALFTLLLISLRIVFTRISVNYDRLTGLDESAQTESWLGN